MRDPSFPVFCALGIFLCLLPLPWHWKARNTGTLLYIGWTIVGCVVMFINSLVWAGNVNDVAPVWCDISSRLVIGLSVGVTASSLCINRRLYCIATIKHVSYTRESKRRETIIDLMLGIGLPVLVMVLQLVVESRRYMIVEDIGCWPTTYSSLVLIPVVQMWPILIGMSSTIYASLTIRAFIKTRRQFSRVLSDSASGLNMSRYFRLMALASTEMLCVLPLSIFFLVSNLTLFGTDPWISWEQTHRKLGEIVTMSSDEIDALRFHRTSFDLNLWLVPSGGFLFFLYFGMSKEATEEYKRVLLGILAVLGIKRGVTEPVDDRCEMASPPVSTVSGVSFTAPTPNFVLGVKDEVQSFDEPKDKDPQIGDIEAPRSI